MKDGWMKDVWRMDGWSMDVEETRVLESCDPLSPNLVCKDRKIDWKLDV